MPDGTSAAAAETNDTQLHTIRDLMLSATQRGAWMTLGEIAALTEIGEASISAQLRHLRKRRHGGHVVEKRRRRRSLAWEGFTRGARRNAKRRAGGVTAIWEYRVLPGAGWDAIALARSHQEAARHEGPGAASAGEILSLVPSFGTDEARCVETGRNETEDSGHGASSLQQAAGEVSDAEARN